MLLAEPQVLFLGLLWHQTGDLTAPVVAAMIAAGVDFWTLWNKTHGPGSSEAQQ